MVNRSIGLSIRMGTNMDRQWIKPGWHAPIYFGTMLFCIVAGLAILYGSSIFGLHWVGRGLLAFGEMMAFVGFMEFAVLRVLGIFRLGALVRVTYYEALLQPFTLIVLVIALVCIIAGSFMPFFTLSEDSKMYRDVATQFVLLFPLIIMVFAAGKVVDEEIENRTMLTLLSKPIARWQVIVGKYLGVACLVLVVVVILGIASGTFAYVRYFDDQRIDLQVAKGAERDSLLWENSKAVIGMVPLMTVEFFQIATLAAISVAISTRWGLALNMTVVALLYVGANLTRHVDMLGLPEPLQWIVTHLAYLLPFLTNFDLSPLLIYGTFTFRDDIAKVPTLGEIWQYVAMAGVYAALYIGAILSIAVAMFRTRELT
jgi:ABC-type transport system involved in multi-copper enzyme maturation permease subunit